MDSNKNTAKYRIYDIPVVCSKTDIEVLHMQIQQIKLWLLIIKYNESYDLLYFTIYARTF